MLGTWFCLGCFEKGFISLLVTNGWINNPRRKKLIRTELLFAEIALFEIRFGGESAEFSYMGKPWFSFWFYCHNYRHVKHQNHENSMKLSTSFDIPTINVFSSKLCSMWCSSIHIDYFLKLSNADQAQYMHDSCKKIVNINRIFVVRIVNILLTKFKPWNEFILIYTNPIHILSTNERITCFISTPCLRLYHSSSSLLGKQISKTHVNLELGKSTNFMFTCCLSIVTTGQTSIVAKTSHRARKLGKLNSSCKSFCQRHHDPSTSILGQIWQCYACEHHQRRGKKGYKQVGQVILKGEIKKGLGIKQLLKVFHMKWEFNWAHRFACCGHLWVAQTWLWNSRCWSGWLAVVYEGKCS